MAAGLTWTSPALPMQHLTLQGVWGALPTPSAFVHQPTCMLFAMLICAHSWFTLTGLSMKPFQALPWSVHQAGPAHDALPTCAQVMGEDLVLVAGQQDRMLRGADVWKHPVAYDKLAVRYRRWRNSLDSCDEREKAAATAALRGPMSAGELFALEADAEAGYMSDLSESEDD